MRLFRKSFKLSIIVLIGILSACAILKPKPKPDQDPIAWKREHPISWEDFKAEPDYKSLNGAIASVLIDIKMKSYPLDEAQVIITPLFYPYRSWVIPHEKDEKGLTHEIYHFHIEEIFARKMRKQFDTTTFAYNDLRKQLWDVYEKVLEDCRMEQKQYDIDIRKPDGEKYQQEWQEKIDAELDALEAYSNTTIKIKVEKSEY